MVSEPPPDATLVELVDERGATIGTAPKLAAHLAPGRRHRAFSVFLLDGDGRLLLQRRATAKYHSGGLWSNTCCSHPAPGEPPAEAAARRVAEELGVEPELLTPAGTVAYRVTDPVSGLVECEWNHLFAGRATAPCDPDPAEVAEIAAVRLDELEGMRAAVPFTAWFPAVLAGALPALGELAPGARG
jgi:isopentenyl-diphosphate delta-isomerase